MKKRPEKRRVGKHTAAAPISAGQRREEGRALRGHCPRSSLAQVSSRGANRDPVSLIKGSSEGRVESLIPLRYSRMLESPFAFFRGSAIVQAADLARTPVTGTKV